MSSPGAEDTPAGGRGSGEPGPDQQKNYPWSLPSGNTGFESAFGPVYGLIQEGNCDHAATILEEKIQYSEEEPGFLGEQDSTILRVGIALCKGDKTTALRYFRAYHWPGYGDSAGWFECHLYAAAGSVLLHRPRSSFANCPAVQPTPPGPTDDPTDTPSPPVGTSGTPTPSEGGTDPEQPPQGAPS